MTAATIVAVAPLMSADKDQDGKTTQPLIRPGQLAGILQLRAPWLHPVGTPVAISRSGNQRLKVAGLAAFRRPSAH